MLSKQSMQQKEANSRVPELYTISEVCDILKCHPNTLRKWDNKGILIAIRIGEKRIRRYKKEDIISFINKNKK